jgi:hypothetical protein
MYIVIFFTIGEELSQPKSKNHWRRFGWTITTSTPFKSKIKWYSFTFDSPRDFFSNRNVVVISCDLCLKCGSYVNVSLTLKNHVQMATSSNPIIWFSDDRDERWTYDFTKCMYLEQNPHIEKNKNIYFSKSWTTLNLQWY